MKNVIKLNHYFCPSESELEKGIKQWVDYYNERKFHESLNNLTPRDMAIYKTFLSRTSVIAISCKIFIRYFVLFTPLKCPKTTFFEV